MLIKKNRNRGNSYFSILIGVLIFAVSYYFSLYYVEGDQSHYTSFYYNIRGQNILTAFYLYRNYIGTSEPVFFIIVYFVGRFIEKNIFMSAINGILMFYLSKLMISQKISKIFIIVFGLNYYLLGLFLAAERLKFSILFFVLFIYYIQKKKRSVFFLILSILSHVQTILFLFSAYINKLLKMFSNIFINFKIKKSSYFIPTLAISVFGLFFLKDHIVSKVNSYVNYGFNITNIIKPAIFLIFTFLIYKKDFSKIFFMFLPMIIGSYFFGETRIVIYAYFLFLFLSFKRSPNINIYILITSTYFTYKGILFLNNVVLYGKGYI